jgi:molecular chaperone DnaJ
MARDYYEVLGLTKGANESEIKKAYRKLVMKHHPDKGGDETKFKEIAEAYETLSDPEKKSNYDRYGHAGKNMNHRASTGGGFGGMSMEDIMNEFGFSTNPFGNARKQKVGRDRQFNVRVTLEEINKGVSKSFKYKRNVPCNTCNGSGGKDVETCPSCNGKGFTIKQMITQMGVMNTQTTCQLCGGEGKIIKTPCSDCNGKGVRYVEESVSVDIPKGAQDGAGLQYAGMGDAIKGGHPGSLFIRITITPHKEFVREGNDLKYNLKLKYHQLILGDKVEVPTIDGGKIRVTIPEYSNIGDNLRVIGKGLPIMNTDNKGNMIIYLDMDIPTKVEGEELELIKKMKKLNENVESTE